MICSKCSKNKEQEQFVKNKRAISGYGSYCKECDNTKSRLKYQSKSSNYKKLRHRKMSLKFKYNLTEEEVLYMYHEQGNSCAICKKPFPLFQNHRGLMVDHDHQTGKVRGLLCLSCNSLLGRANDEIEILNNAIKYLTNV